MKLLRNPVVVGILALVAVVMVGYQFFGNKLFRGRGLFTPKPAPVAASAANPVAPPTPANPALNVPPRRAGTYTNLEAALLPSQGVDAALVEQKFKFWVSAPQRDPFLLLEPGLPGSGPMNEDTNSPVATWSLQGIWNQTDSRLAVINDQVWGVGDVIQPGYKLIRIERDEVWIQGPNRNERLGFAEPKRATLTTPLPKTQPPRGGNRI